MKIYILISFLLLSGCMQQAKQPEQVKKSRTIIKKDSLEQNLYSPKLQKAPDDKAKRDKQSIELILSPTVYPKSCKQLCVVLTNYTSNPIEFGKEHYIELYNHRKWKRINFNTKESVYIFDTIGYELQPNTSQIMHYSLNQERHTYVAGKYRIYVPFTKAGRKDFRTADFYLK